MREERRGKTPLLYCRSLERGWEMRGDKRAFTCREEGEKHLYSAVDRWRGDERGEGTRERSPVGEGPRLFVASSRRGGLTLSLVGECVRSSVASSRSAAFARFQEKMRVCMRYM